MSAALVVIAAFFAAAVGLALLSRRGHEMNLEQWSLAGRGLGGVFVFLLMAGEIYTTFTFLGGSGWAYGKGAPAFYILCYMTIAYAMSYFILPPIWRYARERKLVSQADFFIAKYDSRSLGVLVSLVGVAALVPYLVLQLKGLGIIVSEASYGSISPTAAIWTGTVALIVYVVISGIRGSAWTSALKDVVILMVVAGVGIYLPVHFFGSHHAMFEAVGRAKPGFLTLPKSGMSGAWFASTVLLTACGGFMWPHYFSTVYTARSEDVFRRNAVLLPLYQLLVLFVFFAGFAALLAVPGLTGSSADLSMLRISKQAFSPVMVGVIGGAGILTALVPGSMILITAATILGQNVVRQAAPAASDRTVAIAARASVPLLALVSAIMALRGGQAIVALLLMGYNFVTQLFPSVILALGEKPRVSAGSVFAGIAAGELCVAAISLAGASVSTLMPWAPQPVKDLNVGLVALAVNVVVMAIVELLHRGLGRTEPANIPA